MVWSKALYYISGVISKDAVELESECPTLLQLFLLYIPFLCDDEMNMLSQEFITLDIVL